MSFYRIFFIIIGCLVFLYLLFILVLFILSRSGKWHQLAKTYQTTYVPPKEKIIKNQLGQFNLIQYRYSLIVGFLDEGLYISVDKIFSMFHPPLLIPWSKIKNVKKAKAGGFFRYATMEIDGVKVSLAQEHYDEIINHLTNYQQN